MKFLHFIICFTLLFCKTVEGQHGDFKEWSEDDVLVWEDFRNISENDEAKTAMFGAVTVVTYDYVFLKNGSLSPPVVLFDKLQSWTCETDSLLLKHEQIHFDIHEVNARKIRKEFFKLYEKKDVDTEKYSSILNKFISASEKINIAFDRESYQYSPPRNRNMEWIFKDKFCEVLQRWRSNIDAELFELKKYSLD